MGKKNSTLRLIYYGNIKSFLDLQEAQAMSKQQESENNDKISSLPQLHTPLGALIGIA